MEESRIRETVPMECEAFTSDANYQKKKIKKFRGKDSPVRNYEDNRGFKGRFNNSEGRFGTNRMTKSSMGCALIATKGDTKATSAEVRSNAILVRNTGMFNQSAEIEKNFIIKWM